MIDEIDFARIDELLDQLAAKHRRGEPVTLPADVEADPDLATRVKQLLNAMLAMEGAAAPFPNARRKKKREHAPIERVGEYRIVREIGRGGMGVVYEAEQPALGRRVALKVLPDYSLDDPVAIERFQREARAVARLHHTNIVPVFEVGRDGRRFYFAMQLIAGCGLDKLIDLRRERTQTLGQATPRTVDSVIAEKQLPGVGGAIVKAPDFTNVGIFSHHDSKGSTQQFSASGGDSLERQNGGGQAVPILHAPDWLGWIGDNYYRALAGIGAQAAAALGHAHSRGVVHRDVKPSNFLIDESGIVWVTDFGLAKTDDNDLTRPNSLLGTIRYMAPERFLGHGDARSDLYSLGVTLYEIAAMRPPFVERDQMELIHAISKTEAPSLRSLVPAIPRDYETIVMKAMDKDPERRYQTGEEFQADLERFVADEPVLARRATAVDRFARWCRKEPMVAGLLAAVAALLVCFAGYWRVSARRLAVELERVADLQVKERIARLASEARVVDLQLERSRESRKDTMVGRRTKSLEALREALPTPGESKPEGDALLRLRDEAIATLGQFDLEPQGSGFAMAEHAAAPLAFAFDPTLDRVAVVTEDRIEIGKRLSQGGASLPHRIASLPHRSNRNDQIACQFSPSGDRLLVTTRTSADVRAENLIWNWSDGQQPARISGVECRWLDGDRLLCVDAKSGEFHLFDADKRTRRTDWTANLRLQPQENWEPAPDGKSVARWLTGGRNIEWSRLADGVRFANWTVEAPLASKCRAAWNRDGRLFAVALENGECVIWNAGSGRRETKLLGHRKAPDQITFHPGSTIVVTSATNEPSRFWNPYDGKLLLAAPVSFVRFAAQGDAAISMDGNLATAWRVALAETEASIVVDPVVEPLGNRPPERVVMAFSPDEEALACTQRGGVRFFETRNFREIGSLGVKQANTVSFDATGSTLYTLGNNSSMRWEVRRARGTTGSRWSIGPPELLWRPQGGTLGRTAFSEDKRFALVPVPGGREAALIEFARQQARYLYGSIWWCHNVAISAKNRFVASSGLKSSRVTVWDVADGRVLAILDGSPANPNEPCTLAFSPDERSLVTQSQELIFWDTATWKRLTHVKALPTRPCEAAPVFSADQGLLAVAVADNEIALFDAMGFERIATLRPSDLANIQSLTFSPKGRYLAASSLNRRVRIWNLERLRYELAGLASATTASLDWSFGNSGTTKTDGLDFGRTADAAIEKLEIVGQALVDPTVNAYRRLAASWATPNSPANAHFDRSRAWTLLRRKDDAMAELDRAIAAEPTHFDALLARSVQHADARRLDRALADIQTALQVRPLDREALFMRARLFARMARWREAVADFDQHCNLSRSDNVVRMQRALALLSMGKAVAAADELDDLFSGYFEDFYFADCYLRAVLRTGDAARFDTALRSLRGANATIADIDRIVAWVLCVGPPECWQIDQALQLVQKEVNARPTDAACLTTLALVQLRLGKTTDAFATLERKRQVAKARLTGPEYAVQAMYHLQKGNLNQARRDVRLAANYRDRTLTWRQAFEAAELTLLIDEVNQGLDTAGRNKP